MKGQAGHDVLVIGGGPAGAGAALRLAQHGHRVLLVERQKLPRFKVCGGCIHRRGVTLLERWGAQDALKAGGAEPLRSLTLVTRDATLRCAHMHGMVVDRTRFDAALLCCAESAGAQARDQTSAKVEFSHADPVVTLGEDEPVACRAVVVADGLGGSALPRGPEWSQARKPSSHIGMGAWLEGGCSRGLGGAHGCFPTDLAEGEVRMHLSRGGYVGAVCQRQGEHVGMELAAAVSPALLREHRDPARVIQRLLHDAGAGEAWHDAAGLARWRITPPLTCKRRIVVHHNVFILGDSAGYTEPITGQGITWALASADRISTLLDAHLRGHASLDTTMRLWRRWMNRHRMIHHARCRWTARLLRRPTLVNGCVRVASAAHAWIGRDSRPSRAGAAA